MDKELFATLMAQGFTSAQRLLSAGMNVNALRTNATLLRDEWKYFDDAVIKAAQPRLIGVGDIMSRGLTLNIPNGLGKTIVESQRVSDMGDAEMSMDGITPGRNDRVVYDTVGIPMPIIHRDFQINVRTLNASRERGESLDTTQAALASEKCAIKLEDLLFMGSGDYKFGSYTLYGYTDFPDRNIGSLTVQWAAATAAQIVTDVHSMKAASLAVGKYGPWVLYIPAAYESAMDKDYSASGASVITVRERILKIAGIQDVKVADRLTGNNVILSQMTADSVRIVEGLPLTTVEWQTGGTMIFHFKVMQIAVPELRTDIDGNSGVTHFSV